MELTGEVLLTCLGIAVTIITFIVVYKQTIGVRKERAKNAFNEIIKSIYRNLMIDTILPTYDELNRVISSKIYEHRIKTNDLPLEIDFINTVYTKVIENEFLKTNKKNQLLEKISDLIKRKSCKR